MKKSVIAVSVILLVAAGVVLPAGHFGRIAERTLKSRMANMPYGLQMEMVEYQRGWFSSTARLEWRPPGNLSMPDAPGQGPFGGASGIGISTVFRAFDSGPMTVDLEIAHGPVFFAVGPGVGLFNARGRIHPGSGATEAEAEPREGQGRGNYIDVRMSSFSGGAVTSRLEFRNLDWRLGPIFINLAGGRLDGEWNDADAFRLRRADLEKMHVYGETAGVGIRVSLADIESRTEYPQGLESGSILAPAESSSSIGEVEVAGLGENTLVRVTGLSSLNSAGVGGDGLYRAAGRLELRMLDVMGREFAPVELDQEIGGFSEAAMLKLTAALSAGILKRPPGPQLPEGGPQAPPGALAGILPQLTAEFRDAMRAMLADGPYARIGAVAMYQGEQALKLDARQAFHPDRVPAGADPASLPAILSSLECILDIEVPGAVAEELFGEGLLRMGLTQGLLIRNETAYSLSLALQNGTLELNGRALPLPLPTAEPSPFDRSARPPPD